MNISRRNLLIGTATVVIAAAAGGGYYAWSQGKPPATPATPVTPAQSLSSGAAAELMVPGPLGEQAVGSPNAPVTIDRIRLDDVPALRPVPRDGLSGAQEDLHRHRQGAFHLPRVPARSAGRRRLHAGALRRQGQILPDDRDAVRSAEGLGGAEAAACRCWRSPSRPAYTQESFDACLANQKVLDGIEEVRARAAQKFQVTSTPTFFVNGKMLRGSPTMEELTKQIEANLKG